MGDAPQDPLVSQESLQFLVKSAKINRNAIALRAMAELSPNRIVYVSCNPEALPRDLQQLEAAGYRNIEKIEQPESNRELAKRYRRRSRP